jgi:copper chaperone CopZ
MSSVTPTAELRSELSVRGMTCGNCVRHVHEALTEIPGVRAEVDLDTASATVEHPGSVDVRQLIDAITEAGYEAAIRVR